MSYSLLFWAVPAVLVFWAVGAYNRLVQLRAQANAAFAGLETELDRQVELVRACLPTHHATQPASLYDTDGSFWLGLSGAAAQVSASLAEARRRPLDSDRIGALRAAQDVLAMAWERALREDTHDLAGARLPESITAGRLQLGVQTGAAADRFNLCVDSYNQAIAQFPAVLLAWLFGFRTASQL